MKRPHDLPGVLQNLVQFSCYFNSLVDEYLRQAVRLIRVNINAIHLSSGEPYQLLCDDCLLVERDDQFLSRELRRTKFGQELRYIYDLSNREFPRSKQSSLFRDVHDVAHLDIRQLDPPF